MDEPFGLTARRYAAHFEVVIEAGDEGVAEFLGRWATAVGTSKEVCILIERRLVVPRDDTE